MTEKTSLSLRLALSSALWIVAALLATGWLIVFLFTGHIERRFEHQLSDHLDELVAASDIAAEGVLALTWTPADPRFNRPHSGWYWQIMEGDNILHQSGSLMTARLINGGIEVKGGGLFDIEGPAGQSLHVFARTIRLPRSAGPLVYAVAGPVSDIAADVRRFTTDIAVVLGVLGLLLVGIVVLQVAYGLRPLRRLRDALSAVRVGKADRLADDFPTEVAPLVDELNGLLDYNAGMLERARTQVGNLAHALKNP
ncbi:MAG: ATP-binding protein, partial [Rhodospirillales bacterium]|nr:ATP-binding protein [Rhodospirillales bacterium]